MFSGLSPLVPRSPSCPALTARFPWAPLCPALTPTGSLMSGADRHVPTACPGAKEHLSLSCSVVLPDFFFNASSFPKRKWSYRSMTAGASGGDEAGWPEDGPRRGRTFSASLFAYEGLSEHLVPEETATLHTSFPCV